MCPAPCSLLFPYLPPPGPALAQLATCRSPCIPFPCIPSHPRLAWLNPSLCSVPACHCAGRLVCRWGRRLPPPASAPHNFHALAAVTHESIHTLETAAPEWKSKQTVMFEASAVPAAAALSSPLLAAAAAAQLPTALHLLAPCCLPAPAIGPLAQGAARRLQLQRAELHRVAEGLACMCRQKGRSLGALGFAVPSALRQALLAWPPAEQRVPSSSKMTVKPCSGGSYTTSVAATHCGSHTPGTTLIWPTALRPRCGGGLPACMHLPLPTLLALQCRRSPTALA